jgi:hypothetical protein
MGTQPPGLRPRPIDPELLGPFLPAAAIGCLGGVAAIGPRGTVAGRLPITAPVAAAQYFTTINQPFNATK